MNRLRNRRREGGFLIIAAVFLVVVLAALVGYLMTVSTTSQAASAADLNSARAYQAARAGVEWGTFQILQNPGGAFAAACGPGTTTSNRNFPSTLTAYTATVTCTGVSLTEGSSTVLFYSIVSNACNQPTGGGACPNAAALTSTYVEREVSLGLTSN